MRTLLIAIVGLVVAGLGQPARALVTIGALDTPGNAWDVEVVGGLAYVADFWSGLRVIDVSNPATPVEIGALDTPGSPEGVEVASAGSLTWPTANPACG